MKQLFNISDMVRTHPLSAFAPKFPSVPPALSAARLPFLLHGRKCTAEQLTPAGRAWVGRLLGEFLGMAGPHFAWKVDVSF